MDNTITKKSMIIMKRRHYGSSVVNHNYCLHLFHVYMIHEYILLSKTLLMVNITQINSLRCSQLFSADKLDHLIFYFDFFSLGRPASSS